MRSDFYVGVGTTLFSVAALIHLYRSKASAFGISDLDSNAFPKIVAWILLGFGVLMMLTEIIRGRAKAPRIDFKSLYTKYKKPAGMILLILVYIMLLGKVGFFLTTTAFILAGTLFIGGREKPLRTVLITAGAVVVLYLVFRTWLGQILPGGWLI